MNLRKKSMKQKSKKQRLITRVKDLLLSSTSHGLPNILRAQRRSIKIMWFILFLIFTFIGIFMVYSTISNYLKYEVVTKIEKINEFPVQFPSITFVNQRNPRENISIEKLIGVCIFNNKPCKSNDFEFIQDHYGYISYRFKSKSTLQIGETYGLVISLFNNISYSDYKYLNSFKIKLHNDSSDSRYIMGYLQDGIEISPGYSTSLKIKKEFSSKLGLPFNNCIKDVTSLDSYDSVLYRYILQNSITYTQNVCFDYCIGREFYNYLNITDKIDHYIYVGYLYQNKSMDLLKLYYEIVKENIVNICEKQCPLECDTIRYDVSTSFSKFSNEKLVELYKFISEYNNTYYQFNPLFIKLTSKDFDDFIILSIYYTESGYTSISQLPKMDFFDLISNIGGNLGLFIGVSFLSFAEIIEFIIEVVYILFERNRSKRVLIV
jgi:hypothetical protein